MLLWWTHFWTGLKDGLDLLSVAHVFYCSPTLRRRYVECFLLNGLIFLGSLLLSQRIVMPLLDGLFQERLGDGSTLFYKSLFAILYNVFWTYPIYSISFFLNTIWYGDIASHACKVLHRTAAAGGGVGSAAAPAKNRSLFSIQALLWKAGEEILRNILSLLFLSQIVLFMFIPYVSDAATMLLLSVFYAYYCFEYKWSALGLPLTRRLDMVEASYPYYLGFGLPSTLLTFYLPYFISAGLFAFLFPLLIVAAVVTSHEAAMASNASTHLPVWRIPRAVCNKLLRSLFKSKVAVAPRASG